MKSNIFLYMWERFICNSAWWDKSQVLWERFTVVQQSNGSIDYTTSVIVHDNLSHCRLLTLAWVSRERVGGGTRCCPLHATHWGRSGPSPRAPRNTRTTRGTRRPRSGWGRARARSPGGVFAAQTWTNCRMNKTCRGHTYTAYGHKNSSVLNMVGFIRAGKCHPYCLAIGH